MQLFANHNPEYQYNNDEFLALMAEFPDVEFYFPNHDAAPWHVQCQIGGTVLNFWPHKAKAQEQYQKSVEGIDAMRALLIAALDDDGDLFDVIER